MIDTHTIVTRQNIFQRVGKSFGGMIFGLIMFIAAFPLLWWNEGRAVKTAIAIQEVSQNYEMVDSSQVLPENEGKLIYLQGSAQTSEILKDPLFGAEANAIRLRRDVEMYQWVEESDTETREKIGGTKETTTTYRYSKAWSSRAVDSSKFQKPEGHLNPAMKYTSTAFSAEKVNVGAFTLSSALKSKISGESALPFSLESLTSMTDMPQAIRHQYGAGFFIGEDPNTPKVGDYKIHFFSIPSITQISLISVQSGTSFKPYRASSGRSIEYLESGIVAPEDIVEQAKSRNTVLTWILRGAGVLMLFFGLSALVDPLRQLASVIPALGSLVGLGLGTINFLISIALAFITIAIAWFFYRPLLSGILITFALAVFFVGAKFGKKKQAELETSPPPLPDSGSASPPPPPLA